MELCPEKHPKQQVCFQLINPQLTGPWNYQHTFAPYETRKISVKKRASSPTQPLMEKTFRRKHIIIRFKKHMFGNHCKRARAKPEFDKKKFFKNWSNRDCSHKKVLPMKFVACANKLKFLKRNSPLILHSTKARRSFQTNKFSDDYKRNA